MARIEWSDGLSIGLPAIDAEHAHLLLLFGRLADPARRDDHAFLRGALDQLIEAVCRHFDHEERLMRERRYPDLGAHQRSHHDLLQQINNFIVLIDGQPDDWTGVTIIDFVGRWLIEHIHGDDARMGAFIAGQAAAR